VQFTERFAELMARDEQDVPLDEAALLIAAHAHPAFDLTRELDRISELADRCYAPTLDALLTFLFTDLGFTGNTDAYFDPRNSYLNEVLDRRLGIPISLGVLTMSVGRHLGVPLVGVGMPGHFLLRDRVDPAVFVDPFAQGTTLDLDGCRRAFHAVHGPDAPFDAAYLDPVGTFSIINRMLANLRAVFASMPDRRSDLAWVLRLRTLVPGVPIEERAELAAVLAATGRFAIAAVEYEQLAGQLGGDLGEEYQRCAALLRARLN
jgi:regulator of sirC expression with transglutaminase-like and TPR domain